MPIVSARARWNTSLFVNDWPYRTRRSERRRHRRTRCDLRLTTVVCDCVSAASSRSRGAKTSPRSRSAKAQHTRTAVIDTRRSKSRISNVVVCFSIKKTNFRRPRSFYRAMLCIARTMPSQDVCPSVRHTPVLCRNCWTYPQTFFTISSHTILVFPHQTVWQYSGRDPLTGVSHARRYKWIAIFLPIPRFISEMIHDMATVTTECE